jgi:hypothetical protein
MTQQNSGTVHISPLSRLQQHVNPGLVCLLLLSASLVGCSSPTDDETRLRQQLDQVAEAIEQHDRDTVMEVLAEDFRTSEGQVAQDINRMLLLQFRQNKRIQVFLYDVEVKLFPPMAEVELQALLLGSSQWLPEQGRRYEVQMRWQKQEDDWHLTRLKWRPVLLTP